MVMVLMSTVAVTIALLGTMDADVVVTPYVLLLVDAMDVALDVDALEDAMLDVLVVVLTTLTISTLKTSLMNNSKVSLPLVLTTATISRNLSTTKTMRNLKLILATKRIIMVSLMSTMVAKMTSPRRTMVITEC